MTRIAVLGNETGALLRFLCFTQWMNEHNDPRNMVCFELHNKKPTTKRNAPDVRDIVGTTVLAIVCGFTRYVHINRLRNDTVLAALLGLGWLVISGRKRLLRLTSTHLKVRELQSSLMRIGAFMRRISAIAERSEFNSVISKADNAHIR